MTTLSESPSPSDWAMEKWRDANEREDQEDSHNYQLMYTMWHRIEQEAAQNGNTKG